MKKLFAMVTLASCALINSMALAATTADPDTLRVAVLPDENASTIIKQNEPLKRYLEKELDKKVEIVVTADYSSMIEAMRHGRLELAYFGPLSYVLAKQKSEIEPFAAIKQNGTTTYHALLISNKKANITEIEDIRGKTVVYGDVASTSSHLIPKSMMVEHGLAAGTDYKEHFVGAHDAVAMAVQNGHAQMGGLSKIIFEDLVERGIIDTDKVVIFEESKPFPQYPWTMRSDLNDELKEKIRTVFLKIDDPAILKPFRAEGFGPVQDSDYEVVRNIGSILRLDFSKF
ncbi:phosphate/phosphite/phosphonate ABC transporter substrate-binding protein [Paenalcaligenes faecalis]|uniref:phosphate/phosphite/phosphonate ABC transporter substrate-binding protein n=1 Tax=Paenalcaligenes faecalis TaxID=2980099 RepID=UPI0022B99A52|nr:phosphate/phosphite/phosphonate ABC transporter substrate-binding protein [Paenalcaligenes faecalis]